MATEDCEEIELAEELEKEPTEVESSLREKKGFELLRASNEVSDTPKMISILRINTTIFCLTPRTN